LKQLNDTLKSSFYGKLLKNLQKINKNHLFVVVFVFSNIFLQMFLANKFMLTVTNKFSVF